MAANSSSKLCRRLFQDSKPRTLIQQSLDQLINGEQERFRAKWNFDVNQTSITNTWKVVTDPKASFYVRPPHKLKAKRRLTPSVLQYFRSRKQTPNKCLPSSSLFGNLMFDFSTSKAERLDATESELPQQPISPIHSPAKSSFATTSEVSLIAEPIFKIPALPKVLKRKSNARMTGEGKHFSFKMK